MFSFCGNYKFATKGFCNKVFVAILSQFFEMLQKAIVAKFGHIVAKLGATKT